MGLGSSSKVAERERENGSCHQFRPLLSVWNDGCKWAHLREMLEASRSDTAPAHHFQTIPVNQDRPANWKYRAEVAAARRSSLEFRREYLQGNARISRISSISDESRPSCLMCGAQKETKRFGATLCWSLNPPTSVRDECNLNKLISMGFDLMAPRQEKWNYGRLWFTGHDVPFSMMTDSESSLIARFILTRKCAPYSFIWFIYQVIGDWAVSFDLWQIGCAGVGGGGGGGGGGMSMAVLIFNESFSN